MMTHYLTLPHNATIEEASQIINTQMRLAGHPCPSGDGYAPTALAIHQQLTYTMNVQAREAAAESAATALLLTLDAAEGMTPRLLADHLHDTRQGDYLHQLNGNSTALALHTHLAEATNGYQRLPHGADGSADITLNLANLACALVARLRALGYHPINALNNINLTTIPGVRP